MSESFKEKGKEKWIQESTDLKNSLTCHIVATGQCQQQ